MAYQQYQNPNDEWPNPWGVDEDEQPQGDLGDDLYRNELVGSLGNDEVGQEGTLPPIQDAGALTPIGQAAGSTPTGGVTGQGGTVDIGTTQANPAPNQADQANRTYVPMAGWDTGKLSNPGHTTNKYQFARAVQQIGVPASQLRGNLGVVVDKLREMGINATVIGDDKIDFGDGFGPIDVITSGGTWAWTPGGGAAGPTTTPTTGATTITSPGPTPGASGQPTQNIPGVGTFDLAALVNAILAGQAGGTGATGLGSTAAPSVRVPGSGGGYPTGTYAGNAGTSKGGTIEPFTPDPGAQMTYSPEMIAAEQQKRGEYDQRMNDVSGLLAGMSGRNMATAGAGLQAGDYNANTRVPAPTFPDTGMTTTTSPGPTPAGEQPDVYAEARKRITELLGQDVNAASIDDPDLAPQAAAYRRATERSEQRNREALAERMTAEGLGDSGAMEAGVERGIQNTGEAQGAYNANLVGQKLEARRTQLQQALQLATQIGATDQADLLQRELANLDAQLKTNALEVSKYLGQGQLALGGQQNLLALLSQLTGQQNFYDTLGLDYAQLQRLLNNDSVMGALNG